MKKEQYWLVELDKWDNPELVDGSHSDYAGANKALYLRKRLGFYEGKKHYAIAKIELFECEDKEYKVDEEAINICRKMIDDRLPPGIIRRY